MKKSYPKITSPKGVALYPFLAKPQTKFNPDGVYSVRLSLPAEEAQPFLDKLDACIEEAYTSACEEDKKNARKIQKKYPYEHETDEEGNETGNVLIKFSRYATFKEKDSDTVTKITLKFFNAAGKEIPVEEAAGLYSGSIIRVNAAVKPYYMKATSSTGVKLNIQAVQILEKKSGGNAEYYGFDNESSEADDFVAETAPATSDGTDDF